MSLSAYRELIISSKIDDENAILTVFNNVFVDEPSAVFSLLNIYKELPINNNATIVEIKGANVEFKASPLQLAAINFSSETIIQAPFFNTGVMGKLAYVDLRHQLVALGNFTYAEVLIDQRSTVRVRLRIPLNVTLNADNRKIQGVIRDVSLGGCCLTTLLGNELENAGGLSLHLKMMNEGKVVEIDVPTRVVRVGPGPPHECAMVFQHNADTERMLSVFIYQRQLEIIRELRGKA